MNAKSKEYLRTAAGVVGGIIGFISIKLLFSYNPELAMRFIGGAITGIIIGYATKYFLEKKYGINKISTNAPWICLASGLIGGAVLAIPVALIIFYMVHKRSKKTVGIE